MITVLKSKIHRATITKADLNYDGSITIDERLMTQAHLLPYEQVHVLDINNGNRFVTYVIAGDPASGTICINGAAARLVSVGDVVIILSYQITDNPTAKPTIVRVFTPDNLNYTI